LLAAALFAIAVVSWVVGYYAQESLKDQRLVDIFICTFTISGGLLILVLFARDMISRCPQCGRWLRSRGGVSEDGTRTFSCIACDTNWDTELQASGSGEV
jgi:hypothetical protein